MEQHLVGSMLLSGVDSEEIGDEAEFSAIWTCGATLMALGAVYVGQMTCSGFKTCAKFCLRRLQWTSRHQDEDSHQKSSEESARGSESVKLEHVEQSTPSKSSSSLSIQITTGSQDDAAAATLSSPGQAASTSSMRSRGGERTAASTSSMPSRGGERTSASTSSMPSRGGETTSAAASSSPGQAASTSSMPSRGGERTSASTSSMPSRSGEKTSAAASSSSGQAASTSSRLSRGGERTSAAVAGSLDSEVLEVPT